MLEKNPDLKKLIAETGIHYVEQDLESAGVTTEEFVKVFWKMVPMIRKNLIYAANPDVLKKVLSHPDHKIIIKPPTLMGDRVRGAYDSKHDVVYVVWDPRMTDAKLRSTLVDEYSTAATCAERRPRVGSSTECMYYPDSHKLNAALKEGYEKIDTYQKNFFNYLKNKISNADVKPNSYLKNFLSKMACYEPEVSEYRLTNEEHRKVLQQAGVKQREDGRLYVPAGTEVSGRSSAMELLADVIVREGGIIYEATYAMDESPKQKLRHFLVLWRKCLCLTDRIVIRNFMPVVFKGVLPKKLVLSLSFTVKIYNFFKTFCNLYSEFHHVEDYCDRPCGLTL